MSDSLMKPCPCCGQQESVKIMKASEEESFDASNDDTYAIICDFTEGGCGCCGGYRLTLDEAIEVWNRRAPAQQPAAAPVSGDVALPELPTPDHALDMGMQPFYRPDQMRAYARTYGQQCRDAALERAAVICEEIAQDHWDQYKGRGKHAPNNPRRADTHADGCSDGANQCAEAIRALNGGK